MALPINIHRTFHRIQYASGTVIGESTTWTSLGHGRRNDAQNATFLAVPYADAQSEIYVLDTYSRRCFPNYGEARFHFDAGTYDGEVIFPLSLIGQVIRIQAAPGATDDGESLSAGAFDLLDWKTVWMGRVDQENDDPLSRRRTYYAFDLLFSELRRTMMDKHAYYVAGGPQIAYGHPGYNVGDGLDTRDRDASGSDVDGILAHILPGYDGVSSSTHWTAKDIVESILATVKRNSGNTYKLTGEKSEPTEVLGSIIRQVTVNEGSSAWDVITGVCDRRRSAGICFFDFQDGNIDNPSLYLRVHAQFIDDLTYTAPGGSPKTIKGATENGTAMDFSVAGDQRLIGFRFDDRELWRADYLETLGDRIRVAVTLSTLTGTLESGWPAALESVLESAINSGDLESSSQRVADVYRRFQLPVDWNYVANNGLETSIATPTRCDYRCNDAGAIVTPDNGGAVDTSPLIVRLDRDLPLRPGWDYSTSSAAPYSSGATDQRPSPPLAWEYDNSATELFAPETWNMRFGMRDINIMEPSPYDRTFSDSEFDLIVTASLTLPHRVRVASGNSGSQRRRTIIVPGIQLHLAHPLAIWSIDSDTGVPKYGAAGGSGTTPGIIRDDRDRLASVHAMAQRWYLDIHVGIRLSMNGDGFVQWRDANGGLNDWPKLGYVLRNFSFSQRNGAVFDSTVQQSTFTEELNTPLTAIYYDASTDSTEFTSDWTEMAT